MDGSFVQARILPKCAGDDDRIKPDRFPPCRLIAPAMEDPMVGAAERNRELVADPAAQRPRLRKSQVMGVRWPASAQEARLRGYELEVRTITIAARFAQREDALIDVPGNGIVHTLFEPGTYSSGSDVVRGGNRRR
jgi:hypothetical protein